MRVDNDEKRTAEIKNIFKQGSWRRRKGVHRRSFRDIPNAYR
jgi:hypothetical protein